MPGKQLARDLHQVLRLVAVARQQERGARP
jgi:hypothetical protein